MVFRRKSVEPLKRTQTDSNTLFLALGKEQGDNQASFCTKIVFIFEHIKTESMKIGNMMFYNE
jgi:hypothetical protein